MRVLILILFPFFLFATTDNNKICLYDDWGHRFSCYSTVPALPTISADVRYYKIGGRRSTIIYKNSLLIKSINDINFSLYSHTCLLHNTPDPLLNRIYWNVQQTAGNYHVIAFSRLVFCKKKSGYVYINKGDYWYPVSNANTSPICPEDYIYNPSTSSCAPKPTCNLTCSVPGELLYTASCVCKCAPALTNSNGQCVPNTNLNQADCKKAGGIYLDKISLGDLFSDPKYAFLVMQVPLFSSHLCYTQKWLNTSLGKIKNTLSPKKVLSAAIGLLPLG
uniref:hypothetical protein n=1 Tax=Thermococcus sp. TaxID=35749 RepID=UPI00261BF6AB